MPSADPLADPRADPGVAVAVVCVDFGSTFTKALLVDLVRGEVVADDLEPLPERANHSNLSRSRIAA